MKASATLCKALAAAALWAAAAVARADEVQVAVAANFSAPMQRIADGFARATGHRALLSFGASGRLQTQILQGAPFEVLLAADAQGPQDLEARGAAQPASRFTYAIGRLVLWSALPGRVDAQGAVLRQAAFRHLAIANPKTAPYGAAALEALGRLGLLETLRPKFVLGENVAQVQQFVASGNAELGLLALAQVWRGGRLAEGSAWVVPQTLHAPIRQDAVLLERGRDKPAARALLGYLRGDEARAVIASFGYELPARP